FLLLDDFYSIVAVVRVSVSFDFSPWFDCSRAHQCSELPNGYPNRVIRNIDRSKRGFAPFSRSRTSSPTAGANLKPCPEHALTTTTLDGYDGWTSMMKCRSGVFV